MAGSLSSIYACVACGRETDEPDYGDDDTMICPYEDCRDCMDCGGWVLGAGNSCTDEDCPGKQR